MNDWKEILLGEVIEVVNGFAFKSTNFLESRIDKSLPVIKIKNVANGDVHLNGCQFHYYNNTLDKFVIKYGDVLIALTGNHPEVRTQVVGVASRYKISEKAFLNQRVAKVLPKDSKKLSNDFLYYFLKDDNTHEYLASQSTGSANQANISKADIESIPLNLPPLPEQNAISEVLSSLDEKIDLLHGQNKTLEQIAEALFRQWFVEEAEESWEEKSLDEIAEYLNGIALQKFPGDSLPVIKIREMKQGITENTDRCSNGLPDKYIIYDGDILFSWSGSLEVVIWSGGIGALNQHLFKVSSRRYPKWFCYLATKYYLENFKIIAESKSTTMGHIQREHLSEAKVSIPPKETFNEYDKRIAPLIEKLIRNNSQIRNLTQLRNTLLPKLMTGEVRVKYN